MVFRAALGGILGAKIYFLIENYDIAIDNIGGLWKIIYGILTLNSSLIASGIQLFGSGLVFLGGLLGGGKKQQKQQSLIESILDGDNDGSIVDDLAGMVFNSGKKKSGLGGLLGGLFGRR